MSANNQIGRVYRRDIEKRLNELDKMTSKFVMLCDSKEEIFAVGMSMLTKSKQVLLPLVGIDKLEAMFAEYIRVLRQREEDRW
jgi:hypothetical protein